MSASTRRPTPFVTVSIKVLLNSSCRSRRFTKKQQMQWSKVGAHLLLQTRTQTLDGSLRSAFEKWYPGVANDDLKAVEERTVA